MSSFEELASELSTTVSAIATKRENLRRQVQKDETECDRILSQLGIMQERRAQIQGFMKSCQQQQQSLSEVIQQTEETKTKIIESLRYLNTHLKKMKTFD